MEQHRAVPLVVIIAHSTGYMVVLILEAWELAIRVEVVVEVQPAVRVLLILNGHNKCQSLHRLAQPQFVRMVL